MYVDKINIIVIQVYLIFTKFVNIIIMYIRCVWKCFNDVKCNNKTLIFSNVSSLSE